MPTYVYKFVDTGETIEVQQAFHDDTLTEYAHPESGDVLPVKKVFTPVGVTFKGSGFFKTDNRGKKPSGSSGSGTTDSTSQSGGTSSSESTKAAGSDSGSSGSSKGPTTTTGSSSTSD